MFNNQLLTSDFIDVYVLTTFPMRVRAFLDNPT